MSAFVEQATSSHEQKKERGDEGKKRSEGPAVARATYFNQYMSCVCAPIPHLSSIQNKRK
jgi:hypothetical protein